MKAVCSGREEEGKRNNYAVVDVEESLWSLDDEEDTQGEATKLLMITLVKPPLSEDEIMWKKGMQQKRGACANCVPNQQIPGITALLACVRPTHGQQGSRSAWAARQEGLPVLPGG